MMTTTKDRAHLGENELFQAIVLFLNKRFVSYTQKNGAYRLT
jgi:hypothetical protein